MKKSIFSCFLAATLLACSVQPVPEQSGPQPYVLTASLEGQPDTRTVVQDETKVFWQPGDAVKLFFNGNGSRFTSTNTEPVAVADFTGTLNVVIGFNEGAYMAETIRGAMESVSRGQLEAGYCVGLNFPKIMWHVVLPQAFRTAFPALGNSMISMLKETSMAATISVMEMFRQAQVINGRVYESLGLYCEVAVIYLAFCTLLTWLQRKGEKRLASYGGVRA
jgi:ABC-type amino acid transport system permease subunit